MFFCKSQQFVEINFGLSKTGKGKPTHQVLVLGPHTHRHAEMLGANILEAGVGNPLIQVMSGAGGVAGLFEASHDFPEVLVDGSASS